MMKRTITTLAVLAITMSCAWAQTATQPATSKPKVVLTPEQKKIADTYNKVKPDQAAAKLDVNGATKAGDPNPNFGEMDTAFKAKHERYLKRAAEVKEKPIDLLFLGDSITEGWNGNGKAVFQKEYTKYNPANFGISGDRTQHVLWRIENGELDGIAPKVVVIMIGTNNAYSNTSTEIAAGITKIVKNVQEKLPNSKILLLSVFPRNYSGKDKDGNPVEIRVRLEKINDVISKLDDGKNVRYLEIWKQFLDADENLPKDIMPDSLHPNAKGYQIWADTMRPLLEEMMK